MKACHFLMLTDWFEEIIRNWLQLVCASFRIKWVKMESSNGEPIELINQWRHYITRASYRQPLKVSSYIAQYSIVMIAQSVLHFTSLTDLFNQTPSQLLLEASSHMLQLMRKGCSYKYPPLSIARYSFIQLSELEQCRVKKIAQHFNTAA